MVYSLAQAAFRSGECVSVAVLFRFIRRVRTALLVSIYLGVWRQNANTEEMLRDSGSRLNGEMAFVLNVLGFSDQVRRCVSCVGHSYGKGCY